MCTKIAVISDIQSNKYALSDFLSYADSNNIDMIINLGNFIGNDLYSKEVIRVISDDKRFINILGQNEFSVLGIENAQKNKDCSREFCECEENIPNYNLDSEHIDFLKTLPQSKELNISGRKFFAIHSQKNLAKYKEHTLKALFFQEFQQHFKEETSYDYILYGCTDSLDICTYVNPLAKLEDEILISPGNLFMHKKNVICFVVISIKDSYDSTETIRLKSDSTKMINELINLNKNHVALANYGHRNVINKSGSLILISTCPKGEEQMKNHFDLFKGLLKECRLVKICHLYNELENNKLLSHFAKPKISDENEPKEFNPRELTLQYNEIGDEIIFNLLFESNFFEIEFRDKNDTFLLGIREYRDTYHVPYLNENDAVNVVDAFDMNENFILRIE